MPCSSNTMDRKEFVKDFRLLTTCNDRFKIPNFLIMGLLVAFQLCTRPLKLASEFMFRITYASKRFASTELQNSGLINNASC